ncbi:MAG: hypothetical protein AAF197_06210 [Pseudomonadota bacterium]
MKHSQDSFDQVLKTLKARGLNMSAVIDVAELPSNIVDSMRANNLDLSQYARLVILGNAGKGFWQELEKFGNNGLNPIDRYSIHLAEQLITSISESDDRNVLLYPLQDKVIPLQKLGELVGWGAPAPMGNSINEEYGLWFALRAAFLTSAPLNCTQVKPQRSPCNTCEAKPCRLACPTAAVFDKVENFQLSKCIDHRLTADSSCRSRCFARLACPVGAEHRYPDWAVRQLYDHSLEAIAQWQRDNTGQ